MVSSAGPIKQPRHSGDLPPDDGMVVAPERGLCGASAPKLSQFSGLSPSPSRNGNRPRSAQNTAPQQRDSFASLWDLYSSPGPTSSLPHGSLGKKAEVPLSMRSEDLIGSGHEAPALTRKEKEPDQFPYLSDFRLSDKALDAWLRAAAGYPDDGNGSVAHIEPAPTAPRGSQGLAVFTGHTVSEDLPESGYGEPSTAGPRTDESRFSWTPPPSERRSSSSHSSLISSQPPKSQAEEVLPAVAYVAPDSVPTPRKSLGNVEEVPLGISSKDLTGSVRADNKPSARLNPLRLNPFSPSSAELAKVGTWSPATGHSSIVGVPVGPGKNLSVSLVDPQQNAANDVKNAMDSTKNAVGDAAITASVKASLAKDKDQRALARARPKIEDQSDRLKGKSVFDRLKVKIGVGNLIARLRNKFG